MSLFTESYDFNGSAPTAYTDHSSNYQIWCGLEGPKWRCTRPKQHTGAHETYVFHLNSTANARWYTESS